MSRTAWKLRERQAAALIHGRRYPANTGGAVDCDRERKRARALQGSPTVLGTNGADVRREPLGRLA
jgi:hypothetical protein